MAHAPAAPTRNAVAKQILTVFKYAFISQAVAARGSSFGSGGTAMHNCGVAAWRGPPSPPRSPLFAKNCVFFVWLLQCTVGGFAAAHDPPPSTCASVRPGRHKSLSESDGVHGCHARGMEPRLLQCSAGSTNLGRGSLPSRFELPLVKPLAVGT